MISITNIFFYRLFDDLGLVYKFIGDVNGCGNSYKLPAFRRRGTQISTEGTKALERVFTQVFRT